MPGRSRQVSLTALAAKTALPERTEESTPPPAPAAAPAPEPAGAPAVQTADLAPHDVDGPRRRAPRRKAATPAPGQWVRYDQYERKEARLRPDQYGRLSDTSRALNRARAGAGERITENTLIRVAIDLLLGRDQELTGATEVELRKSLGL